MNVAAAFNIQIEYLFWFKNAFCNLTHFLFIQPQNKHFLPKVGWVGRQGTLRSEKQREFERRQVKTLAGRGIRKGGKHVESENLMVGLMNSMSLCLSVGNKKQDAFVVSSFSWLENSVDDRGILWGDLEKNYLYLLYLFFSPSLHPSLLISLPSSLSSLSFTPLLLERDSEKGNVFWIFKCEVWLTNPEWLDFWMNF